MLWRSGGGVTLFQRKALGSLWLLSALLEQAKGAKMGEGEIHPPPPGLIFSLSCSSCDARTRHPVICQAAVAVQHRGVPLSQVPQQSAGVEGGGGSFVAVLSLTVGVYSFACLGLPEAFVLLCYGALTFFGL